MVLNKNLTFTNITNFRINQACTIIEWKIHEYVHVEIYKKHSQKKVERNILVNTPARTARSDGPNLQKGKTRGGSRMK